ncbi:hypothetical protein KP509_24G020000 [Ceratopteris richardii]|uniref:Cytochrome P450 n=1 Tax=Ceratopteris richardii TaxID=49495 RepID=A0A8T2RVD5_CERRI|nr:hypothetical protein KP509_24G020000 [Ceratopteris richardii]
MGLALFDVRYTEVCVALLVVVLGSPLVYATQTLLIKWLRVLRARRMFETQGFKCLPRPFFTGNLPEFVAINKKARSEPMPDRVHAVAPRVLPYLYKWSQTYGEYFIYWFGFQPRYIIQDPEVGKELLVTKSGHFKKPSGRPDTKDLTGMGLVSLDGEKWAQHRRIINPAFFVDKLKAMAPTVGDLTVEMMRKWEPHVKEKEAINVAEEFQNLTADIIAHTAFGSSFGEGKEVFYLQHEQQVLVSKLSSRIYIPGSQFFPTQENWHRKSIDKRIRKVLGQIIGKRLELGKATRGDSYGNDLLGLMLAANQGVMNGNARSLSMGLDELIDECKTFFFAGHETTATLLTFMFLLLATHPEWQERLREEVREVCGNKQIPTADSLNNMKLMSMVIYETLRLYPPAVSIFRETDNDIKLGNKLIPAGTVIIVPIIAWHQDEQFWGANAKEFHPERFDEGITKACKVSGAYLPFSFGPRNCIGQVFATIEAKMVLATILQRYRFCISSQYVHAPTVVITLKPEFGMPIVFEEVV